MVKFGQGYERFDEYVLSNHDDFEKTLVKTMHEHDKSLEWVVDQIINGKQTKTETV